MLACWAFVESGGRVGTETSLSGDLLRRSRQTVPGTADAVTADGVPVTLNAVTLNAAALDAGASHVKRESR